MVRFSKAFPLLSIAALGLVGALSGCSPDHMDVVKTDTSNPAGVTMTPEQKQQTIEQIQNNSSLPPNVKARLLKQAQRFGTAGSGPSIPH